MARYESRRGGGGASRRSEGSSERRASGSSRRGNGGGNSSESSKKLYKKIGNIWDHSQYGESITIDDYHGDLIFVPKDGKGEFKVKRIYMSEPYRPHEVKGSKVTADLKIDLANDKCVESLD